MDTSVTKTGEISTVNVPGNLDVAASTTFKQTLEEVISNSVKIELDFSKTELVTSAGLRVLLQAEKNVKKAEKTMVFINVSKDVMEIFELTGVTKIFKVI
ncbi:MAG: STAS domain-containing protein [Oscillospiraceae bacterium]|nr:STAS domain-containing protein [Oscillospiraceae bacterium]